MSRRNAHDVGRNDPCHCGSGKKYKRCCLDKDTVLGRPTGNGIAVLVETPRGPMVRLIPPASPLPAADRQGAAAEQAAHEAAAIWGLPDFAYEPGIEHSGSGPRELGDLILIVGSRGAVVQVKSREAQVTDPDRERAWIVKQTERALRQANGTIRNLCRQPATLTNLRGYTREVDGSGLSWLSIVVIDHPDPPDGCTPSIALSQHPAIVLLRRDWEFLFDQLKSTHAVLEYVERVSDEVTPLGHEPMRYYGLARADHEATPSPLPPEIARRGKAVSIPLLPLAPAGTDDRQDHVMFRMILEDIAVTHLTEATEEDRLRVLSELDRLQVGRRGMVGRHLREAMQLTAQAQPPEVVWKLQRIVGEAGTAHLGFGACSSPHSDDIARAFSAWVQLRHHDHQQLTGEGHNLTTVAVLLTPRPDRDPPYDTTMCAVAGDLQLDEDDLAIYRKVWPSSGYELE
jgi:hypothetical protein